MRAGGLRGSGQHQHRRQTGRVPGAPVPASGTPTSSHTPVCSPTFPRTPSPGPVAKRGSWAPVPHTYPRLSLSRAQDRPPGSLPPGQPAARAQPCQRHESGGFRAHARSAAQGRKASFPEPCQLSDRRQAGRHPARRPRPLQAELTDERRQPLVAGGRVSPGIRLPGQEDRRHPRAPRQGGSGHQSPSVPQHLLSAMFINRPASEGGRQAAGRGGGRGPAPWGLLGAEKGELGEWGAAPCSRPLDALPW